MIQRMISTLVALALVALPLSAADEQKEADRLDNCGTVLKEILDIPDNIPTDLLDKAECVIVIPSVLKAAFVIGGSYGKGAMTCRTGEHFTAAGPKGRDAAAASDVTMRAEMLTYSRSRGLFAGISLEGSTLRQDNGANERLYKGKVTAEQVVRKGAVAVPPSGQEMIALLNKKSPKNLSDPNSLKE